MSRVFLSCGSNLGLRQANLEAAVERLALHEQIVILNVSHSYETQPVDFLEQPDFLNNVVELITDLKPQQLLELVKQIEIDFNAGSRVIPKGPRLLDIDILLWDEERIAAAELQVPHPSMCNRRFVLVPLLEVTPELGCPIHGRPFSDCLAALDQSDQRVELAHG